MSKHNLLDTSKDLFQKLLSDFNGFSANVVDRYKAMDCALTAWHLTDWVYKEYESTSYSNLGDMRGAFYLECDTLKVMHDIANGSKHLTLDSDRIKSTMAQSRDSFEDFVTPTVTETVGSDWLLIDFQDGTSKTMLELLDEVITFWTAYFARKSA